MMPMVARIAATDGRAGMHVCGDSKANGKGRDGATALIISACAAVFPYPNERDSR